MKSKSAVAFLIAVFLLTGFSGTQFAKAAGDESEALMAAVTQFYTALNVMFTGDVNPMKESWSHADDVVYMGPDGVFIVGWEKLEKKWEAQAALKLRGKVETADMKITMDGNMAVTHNYENGENIVNGEVQKVSIRATNVFRKENGTWKMIGHHTDLLPFLNKGTAGE